jgi:hypothetical protein
MFEMRKNISEQVEILLSLIVKTREVGTKVNIFQLDVYLESLVFFIYYNYTSRS